MVFLKVNNPRKAIVLAYVSCTSCRVKSIYLSALGCGVPMNEEENGWQAAELREPVVTSQ